MQRELHKSQQLTKKYQQLLELEKRKLGGVGSGHVTPVSTGDEGESPRVPHPSSYSLLGGNVRVNDIIRKNEVRFFLHAFYVDKCVSILDDNLLITNFQSLFLSFKWQFIKEYILRNI